VTTALPPGRELDIKVAMGFLQLVVNSEFDEPFAPALRDRYDEWGILPTYSTDMGAAWGLLEVLHTRYGCGVGVQRRPGPPRGPAWKPYVATATAGTLGYARPDLQLHAQGDTAAHAICLLVLAVMRSFDPSEKDTPL
jgi:hypothetical protein